MTVYGGQGDPGVQVPYRHKSMNDGRPAMRTCCPSRMNEYHEETCPNAGQNDEWRSLGGIRWGVEAFTSEEHEWLRRQSLEDNSRRTENAGLQDTALPSVAQEEPGGYRDLSEIISAEIGRIRPAADKLLSDLGIRNSNYWETYQRMAEFYLASLILLHERNEMAHDAWRRTGWAGNLMTLFAKVNRLMHALWWHPSSDARTEKPLDHFGDAAIYAGMCAILFQIGDERGSQS